MSKDIVCRYMVVALQTFKCGRNKIRKRKNIILNTPADASKKIEELKNQMRDSSCREFLYKKFITKKLKDGKVKLSFDVYKIISTATLEEIDEAILIEYNKSKNIKETQKYISNLKIAYLQKGGIELLNILTPEEIEYVKSIESLRDKIFELFKYKKDFLSQFCKSRKAKCGQDLHIDLSRLEKALPISETEVKNGIENYVRQLYYGSDKKNPEYKRFRGIALYIKSETERLHDKSYKEPTKGCKINPDRVANIIASIEKEQLPAQLKLGL